MIRNRSSHFLLFLTASFKAVLVVAVTTFPLFMIGRETLGEGVVALTLLLPVTWSAYKWGQLPGIAAALTAGLCFNFLFIPPLYTFVIGRLEGWIVLGIFMIVTIVVVGRIQASLTLAREAVLKYQLSAALTGLRTQEAVAHATTREFTRMFQTSLVNFIFYPTREDLSVIVSEPPDYRMDRRADRLLSLVNCWGYCGEIQIWRGPLLDLPAEESRLLKDFASQIARALERTRSFEQDYLKREEKVNALSVP
jgi:K+-sensing histidine kinase KdpD